MAKTHVTATCSGSLINTVCIALLVSVVCAQQKAPFYGNVCSREERACGVYPVTNFTDHTLLQTYLSIEGPALDNYTIYISPFAVSCTPPYCWRPNPTTIDPGPRHVWNSPPLLVDIDGLSIKSAFPNVADPRIYIEHDEVTVQASSSLTLGCSAFLVVATDFSAEDMLLSIDQGCSDWIEDKKQTDVGDYAGIIVSASVFGSFSAHNVELTGGLVAVMIVPTLEYQQLTVGDAIYLDDVSVSTPLTGKGRAQAALLFRVQANGVTLVDTGSTTYPVMYLGSSNITLDGTSVAYNLSYELPPNGMSIVDPASSTRIVYVTKEGVQEAVKVGVWICCALLIIILAIMVWRYIHNNNEVREKRVGYQADDAKRWVRDRKEHVASSIVTRMHEHAGIDLPQHADATEQAQTEEAVPTTAHPSHQGMKSRKGKKR